jgi:hypothetical protein
MSKDSILEKNFISLPKGRFGEKIEKFDQLFLIGQTFFIGDQILFCIPKGNAQTFAFLPVGHEIYPSVSLLGFEGRHDTLFEKIRRLFYFVNIDPNFCQACIHLLPSLLFFSPRIYILSGNSFQSRQTAVRPGMEEAAVPALRIEDRHFNLEAFDGHFPFAL